MTPLAQLTAHCWQLEDCQGLHQLAGALFIAFQYTVHLDDQTNLNETVVITHLGVSTQSIKGVFFGSLSVVVSQSNPLRIL